MRTKPYGRLNLETGKIERAPLSAVEMDRLNREIDREVAGMRQGFKSDSDRWAVINALKVAAERYAEHEAVFRAQGVSGAFENIAERFKQQAADARRLAEEIEQWNG